MQEEVKPDKDITVNWVFWKPDSNEQIKIALDAMIYQTELDEKRMEKKYSPKPKPK